MIRVSRTSYTPGLILLAALLTGCVAAQERSEQQEAFKYQVQQHDASGCAELGLVPGSASFTACMDKLAEKPVASGGQPNTVTGTTVPPQERP